MAITQNSIIGIDVCKNSLDICIFAQNKKHFFKIENTTKDIHKFIRKLPKTQTSVFLEPTGGYEKLCISAFLSADIPVFRPSALQVRTFAKGCGIIAKNDKIDAEILVEFALKSNYAHQVMKHDPIFYHTKHQAQLGFLWSRMKELVLRGGEGCYSALRLLSLSKHRNIRRIGFSCVNVCVYLV